MSELKPCPLCGSEARLANMDGVVENGHTLRFAACSNEQCQVSVWKHSDEKATAVWNQRYQTAWCACGDSHTSESVCVNCLMSESSRADVAMETIRQAMNHWAEHEPDICKAPEYTDIMTALERGEG